jgi:UrcA family protein
MLSDKLFAILAACGVSLSGVAAAAPVGKPVFVTGTPTEDVIRRNVIYRDLNLATEYGEKKLHRRVSYAVSDVCNQAVGREPGMVFFREDCRKSAWDSARPQISQAVQRAREIATSGASTLAPVAISIAFTAE